MSKDRKAKIEVKGKEITVISSKNNDYISITDIARYKEPERTDHLIQNWMRNRNTIEFLGLWEQLYNENFKPLEFEGFIAFQVEAYPQCLNQPLASKHETFVNASPIFSQRACFVLAFASLR